MLRKSHLTHLCVLAVGFTLGTATDYLFQRVGPEPPIVQAAPVADSSRRLPPPEGQRPSNLASGQERLENLAPIVAGPQPRPPPPTPSEQREYFQALVDEMSANRKKRATEMLLAAGYSAGQIEWLRNRSAELQKERRQAETERRIRGLPVDPAKEMAYLYDEDIELRYEIGDDEYERYRKALGRPVNVDVTEVLPGSIADSAGMKVGDVIVSYDNKRLFNLGELNGSAIGKVGKTAVVTVKRDGQLMQFVVPGGILGVKSHDPIIENSIRIVP